MRRRVALAVAALFVLLVWLRVGGLPTGLLDEAQTESTVVVDRHGAVLYEALSHDGTRAIALAPDQLPPMLVAATVAAEDHRYWSHPGIDPIAMLRALRVNLAERRVVEGGSTISQQVAKLLLNRRDEQRERGLAAKLHEGIIALRLEHQLSKHEILALYLNLASYGNQLVGAERASRAYFGVGSAMLTPAQAAFLAGLPQRPTRFNPYKSRALAVSRQQRVLARMTKTGVLTAEEGERARQETLTLVPAVRPFEAPHFVEMVLADTAQPRPARIVTTLDRELQRAVAGIIASHRAQLTRHGAGNVAVVVLDNASGEWLAWEGSGSYEDGERGGRLNGAVVPRQPGSALKPFTYAVAFDRGFTPASVLADVPAHFATADPGVSYAPRNYDGRYRGPLRARHALGGSQNVPAVVLASHMSVPVLLRSLSRAGLTTFDKTAAHYGLGVTLGNAEVRLDELTAAYAAFARGGAWLEATALLGRQARATRQLFSPEAAFWITDVLADADAREAVFGRGGYLEFPFPVAVKTGTSQAYHDNWTLGYSRHVTVGVWVGNFDRSPLRNSSGVTGAAPIFHAVMLAAEARARGAIDFSAEAIVPRPPSLHRVEICALSGQRAHQWCRVRASEWLPRTPAAVDCDWHRLHDGDVVVDWPPQFIEWARGEQPSPGMRFAAAAARRPSREARAHDQRSRGAAFAITNPPDGATYLIDPTLRREFQSLPLRVVSSTAGPIEWFVNGVPAGRAASSEAVAWPLAPGRHRITAHAASGLSAAATIDVR